MALQWFERSFNWEPEPTDHRDWQAEPILKAVRLEERPPRVRNAHLILSILDQLRLGSCASNAIAQGLRAALVRLGVPAPVLISRLFLYYYARAIRGWTQEDIGTYLRDNFEVIRKLGFAPESAWTYDDGPSKFRRMPDAAAMRLAHDQVGNLGYFKIHATGAERVALVKDALAAGYTVAFGTQVTRRFATFKAGDAPLTPPGQREELLGGHAILAAGYGPGYVDIVNSHGPDYGDAGWCQFEDDYIADSRSSDFWIIEKVPNFSEIPR